MHINDEWPPLEYHEKQSLPLDLAELAIRKLRDELSFHKFKVQLMVDDEDGTAVSQSATGVDHLIGLFSIATNQVKLSVSSDKNIDKLRECLSTLKDFPGYSTVGKLTIEKIEGESWVVAKYADGEDYGFTVEPSSNKHSGDSSFRASHLTEGKSQLTELPNDLQVAIKHFFSPLTIVDEKTARHHETPTHSHKTPTHRYEIPTHRHETTTHRYETTTNRDPIHVESHNTEVVVDQRETFNCSFYINTCPDYKSVQEKRLFQWLVSLIRKIPRTDLSGSLTFSISSMCHKIGHIEQSVGIFFKIPPILQVDRVNIAEIYKHVQLHSKLNPDALQFKF
jgi:hypothetical protein